MCGFHTRLIDGARNEAAQLFACTKHVRKRVRERRRSLRDDIACESPAGGPRCAGPKARLKAATHLHSWEANLADAGLAREAKDAACLVHVDTLQNHKHISQLRQQAYAPRAMKQRALAMRMQFL